MLTLSALGSIALLGIVAKMSDPLAEIVPGDFGECVGTHRDSLRSDMLELFEISDVKGLQDTFR